MRVTFYVEATLELADPDDYPPEVTTWEAAAEVEWESLSVQHEAGVNVDFTRGVQGGGLRIRGDKEFKRSEEDTP